MFRSLSFSLLLRLTDSDYLFGIFKLFLFVFLTTVDILHTDTHVSARAHTKSAWCFK